MYRLLTFILLSLLSSYAFAAGDPILGQQKAPSCVFCHGSDGIATQSSYPNLRGQTADYLFQSMKSYQQGERSGPMADMMKAQLQRLNDQDLRDVAAFYASKP
ncbi:c-type cytochrome [Vibrio metoecus]|uniref:c-type cytochrome n=1 Tax=Vibrio metoecus TaxID=1481663 RepID=UPI000BA9093F|nr:cytochrome c [Vibrio metoecus]MCR9387222.1 cytochrome c [Vibrio metoecus]PAR47712.1 cytochrome C554 [Vibrio metoecus]